MKKKLLITVTAVLAAFTLAACGNSNKSKSADGNTIVKVGVVGTDDRIWDNIASRAKKEKIDIKLVHFTDYDQPNAALKSGQIDLNAFQHFYFLDQWNKANNGSIKSIGKTVLAPIRLYPGKGVSKLSDIKKGAQIVIPNDPTNEGRALTLLQTAGLIKLKKAALPTPNDIKENKLGLKIVPVDAAQTARQLSSVAAAVVNDSTAQDAKLKESSAIYIEPVNKASQEWINIIAANSKDLNNPTYKKVVNLYQTQTTKDLLKKVYGDTEIPAWDINLK
ncbi:MetQ/NlpA family ABC transporter substrate-binding protein [Periweissella fabalis]|uniref:Lipoprotein n=1 Tax=Periweissella fabalis TaxID=1070421 RepID=A0A7X6S362_9LACO|nr:MetQ/NlpA family ABC transporter substrate-binding protein [Periweissella fabalis]MCM0598266.1 MetQ/NlpA family ABC transporter substrate-binding protein [Periweissella fabalis]NKZ24799.1 MetQ/NlpA family ABC transporter substrate-binding protein [Periweissella fabalis]